MLDFKSPLEVLQERQPDLTYLKVFGCTGYVHLPATMRDKLDPRAVKCIFLGYSQTKKGYKCYESKSKKKYITRDVQFVETSPYFEGTSQEETLSEFFLLLSTDHSANPSLPVTNLHLEHSIEPLNPATDHTITPSLPVTISNDNLDTSGDVLPEGIVDHIEQQSSNDQDRAELLRRNPPRTRQPPTKLQDYVAHTVRYLITQFRTYQRLSPLHTAFITAISSVHEPKNFHKAQSQGVWQKAMAKELTTLEENKTWSIVLIPPGKHAVGSRWIFKTKFNSNGSINRHKAHLVA
jgi:hypothetical protein